MLHTIADLLQEIIVTERSVIDQLDITHPGTIGEMYEGLTRSTLERSIPHHLVDSLRVTHGFIRHPDGKLSREIDCMVVRGAGEPIPHTDRQIVPLNKVVAVIEIKKNLFGADLQAAHNNLLSVSNTAPEGEANERLLCSAFQMITGYAMPEGKEDVGELPRDIRHIYYSLLWDAFLPPRIIFGYNGYSSENGLRNAFVDYLSTKEGKPFCNPSGLPNLVCSNGYSILKLNGMPDQVRMEGEMWPLLASTDENPVYLLLDQIFCRLNFDGEIPPEFFDDPLFLPTRHLLGQVEFGERDDRLAWHMDILGDVPPDDESARDVRSDALGVGWSPAEVTHCEQVVLMGIDTLGVDFTDPDLIEFLESEGETPDSICRSLQRKRLATRVGDSMQFLTTNCKIAMLRDGKTVAGEDIAGRVSKYVAEFGM